LESKGKKIGINLKSRSAGIACVLMPSDDQIDVVWNVLAFEESIVEQFNDSVDIIL
jgi:hypothetical protein